MKKVYEDPSGERLLYLCHARCGNRVTFLCSINGLAQGWPPDVREETIRQVRPAVLEVVSERESAQ